MYLSEYQTVDAYEQSLANHAQYVRWMKALPCTCTNPISGQANPQCPLCKGRGVRYVAPTKAHIQDELAYTSFEGNVKTKHPFVAGFLNIRNQVTNQPLVIATVVDSTTVKLVPPYARPTTPLSLSYDAALRTSFVDDVCQQVATLSPTKIAIRPNGIRLPVREKTYYGTIGQVTSVKIDGVGVSIVSKDRDLIIIDHTGVVISDTSIIVATYDAAMPFRFLVHSISDKVRWELGYVQESAEAIVVVPYYIKAAVNDVFTILSAEQVGSVLIDPTLSAGNDVITNYFDIVKILSVTNADGDEMDISALRIYNRNELMWDTKPAGRYVVQFLYNPTFVVIPALPTLRNAEDKAFVNRLNVVEFTRLSGKATF